MEIMSIEVGDKVPENKVKKKKLVGEEIEIQTGSITTHF